MGVMPCTVTLHQTVWFVLILKCHTKSIGQVIVNDNVVYFRAWDKLPGEAYEQLVTPSHISQQDTIDLKSYIHESPRVEGWNEFVMSGLDLDRLRQYREDYLTDCLDKGLDINPDNIDIVLGDQKGRPLDNMGRTRR